MHPPTIALNIRLPHHSVSQCSLFLEICDSFTLRCQGAHPFPITHDIHISGVPIPTVALRIRQSTGSGTLGHPSRIINLLFCTKRKRRTVYVKTTYRRVKPSCFSIFLWATARKYSESSHIKTQSRHTPSRCPAHLYSLKPSESTAATHDGRQVRVPREDGQHEEEDAEAEDDGGLARGLLKLQQEERPAVSMRGQAFKT